MTLEDVPRPPDNVVEKIYAEVLEQLAMPAATAQNLIATQTIEKKWKMIQMNAELVSNENMQSIRSWGLVDEEFLHQVHLLQLILRDPHISDRAQSHNIR
jgi:hypothetical protein